jgi:hypothetical protein
VLIAAMLRCWALSMMQRNNEMLWAAGEQDERTLLVSLTLLSDRCKKAVNIYGLYTFCYKSTTK